MVKINTYMILDDGQYTTRHEFEIQLNEKPDVALVTKIVRQAVEFLLIDKYGKLDQ